MRIIAVMIFSTVSALLPTLGFAQPSKSNAISMTQSIERKTSVSFNELIGRMDPFRELGNSGSAGL